MCWNCWVLFADVFLAGHILTISIWHLGLVFSRSLPPKSVRLRAASQYVLCVYNRWFGRVLQCCRSYHPKMLWVYLDGIKCPCNNIHTDKTVRDDPHGVLVTLPSLFWSPFWYRVSMRSESQFQPSSGRGMAISSQMVLVPGHTAWSNCISLFSM